MKNIGFRVLESGKEANCTTISEVILKDGERYYMINIEFAHFTKQFDKGNARGDYITLEVNR